MFCKYILLVLRNSKISFQNFYLWRSKHELNFYNSLFAYVAEKEK